MRGAKLALALSLAVAGVATTTGFVAAQRARTRTDERNDQVRAEMAKGWNAQAEALDRTRLAVQAKAQTAITQRAARARAAALILANHVSANSDDAMDNARRHAAAKLVLTRERAEVLLLTAERDQLVAASDAIGDGAASALTVALPPNDLLWPSEGSVARSFGTYVHTRSKATLSRRGIDIEVDEHAQARASAGGVIRFSGPIRGLDNGVIIDHGTYYTVLAKLGKLTRNVGATINAGDSVGRAASSRIYLELRIKVGPEGTPVDPQMFLRKRSAD